MRALALLLALAISGCSGCASVPKHDDLRSLTLSLRFQSAICSGTAIGPTVILTASHCFEERMLTSINGRPAQAAAVKHDGHDRAVVVVRGVAFDRWARLGDAPKQGDRVRWWGNPRGLPGVYRQGYVALVVDSVVIVDATACKGDSGAGLFNDRGEVVGMVSAITEGDLCQFGIARR